MWKAFLNIWQYIAELLVAYFAIALLAVFGWIAVFPDIKTGSEWFSNSTLSTVVSNMNIFIPVAMYWIVIIIIVAFLFHATIGIITKRYKKPDIETKIEGIDIKLQQLIEILDKANNQQTPKP